MAKVAYSRFLFSINSQRGAYHRCLSLSKYVFLPYSDIISIHTDAAIDQLNLALDQFLQFKNGIPISCGSRCLQLFLNKTPGKF